MSNIYKFNLAIMIKFISIISLLIIFSNIGLAELENYSPELNIEEILTNTSLSKEDAKIIYNEIINNENFINNTISGKNSYLYIPFEPYQNSKFNFILLYEAESLENINISLLNKNKDKKLNFSIYVGDINENNYFVLYYFYDEIIENNINYSLLFQNNDNLSDFQIYNFSIITKENTFFDEEIDSISQQSQLQFDEEEKEELIELLALENMFYTNEELSNLIEESKEYFQLKTDVILTTRKYESGDEKNFSKVILTIIPKENLNIDFNIKNISLIHEISKEYSITTKDIIFEINPDVILKEDPLIMWQFADVETAQNLAYEKQTSSKVTGNSIIIFDKEDIPKTNYLKIILPLLLIPLIAFLLIFFSRFSNKIK